MPCHIRTGIFRYTFASLIALYDVSNPQTNQTTTLPQGGRRRDVECPLLLMQLICEQNKTV